MSFRSHSTENRADIALQIETVEQMDLFPEQRGPWHHGLITVKRGIDSENGEEG
jgi:hypothetical protein